MGESVMDCEGEVKMPVNRNHLFDVIGRRGWDKGPILAKIISGKVTWSKAGLLLL